MINWPKQIKLTETKYSKWYTLLIDKSINRLLSKDVYTENHHIIPKSWGGSNDKSNLVRLTAREHYIAHAFLWKMTVNIGYHNKMTHAFNAMSIMKNGSYNKPSYRINSRLFEAVRLERIVILKTLIGPLSPSFGKKLNVSEQGKLNKKKSIDELWADPVRRANILEKRKIASQRPESIEKRKRNADLVRGVKRDPVIVEKSASKRRGRKGTDLFSEQALKNMKEGNKNKIYTPEGKQRQIENSRRVGQLKKSESFKKAVGDRFRGRTDMVGENNPNFGNKWTNERKQSMSLKKTGILMSDEVLQKRREKMSKKPLHVCEHCSLEISNRANYNRWHGNNCKLKKVTIED